MTTKFSDITKKFKGVKERIAADMEHLDSEIDSVATDADEVVRQHHVRIAPLKTGIKEMKEELEAMIGNGEEEEQEKATFQSDQKKDG